MKSIISKVAYLNGLIDGMDIDQNTKEGKAINQISEILKEVAEEIESLKDSQKYIENYVDIIDEDLSRLEEEWYYDEEYEEDDECCKEDFENYINVKCPHCNEIVYIDNDICKCNKGIICPNCHEEILLSDVLKENK
ncbi:hypothetical protein SAMN05428976_102369 [Clostridium sp. USBA 49]|jgi:hypothetical protein|uniref:CD1247 N-terminal domain-containing protein n=1 Tax=Clostridium TaxID=1485 RepID=UPI00099AF955|nr:MULTISPECIES: CD1247 N-terminal domain-containing protein [Clostridium]SKA76838.1 hypothetical protein SAMN05428976_102369 [Clostridium sp. USBA 49]